MLKMLKTYIIILGAMLFVFSGCNNKATVSNSKKVSSTTGWKYNDEEAGTLKVPDYIEQKTGPGLVLIEGGTFTMGRTDEDVMFDWNNIPRRVTVSSFYIDETEVTNIAYLEYLDWLTKVYPGDRSKMFAALPDTNVWRESLSYNEPLIQNYLRHPAYADYPVVGVSWEQANEYCKWRTDRVNELMLIEAGILSYDKDQQGSNVFNTQAFLDRKYTGIPGEKADSTTRVKWEDGLMLPSYRLPTEAQWEYAALGLIGEAEGELLTERRIYPWKGPHLREAGKKDRGRMKANFTRGRGDLMGMAGALNDNADSTSPVTSYEPNDYGLYCMAGNVNEWVADVYRPLSPLDMGEYQPFRGNVLTEYRKDDNGKIVYDDYGQPIRDTVLDLRNINDGDFKTVINDAGNWNDVD